MSAKDLGVTTQANRGRVSLVAARKLVKERIRRRVRARLDELGMTARELARAVRPEASDGERDSWISGILKGVQGLSWKHFDAVADKIGLPPSELVRYDDDELRELTPNEMRLIRHYREWPRDIQDRWLALLDHFAATVPDKDTAKLLDQLRAHPPSLRRPVLSWLARLLEGGIPPEAATGGVELGQDEELLLKDTKRPVDSDQKARAGRRHVSDRRRRNSPTTRP